MRIEEYLQVKCEPYWPNKVLQKVIKGMYIIQLLSEKRYSNFIIRQLNMTSKEVIIEF